jgi:AsmA protein
MAFHCREPPAQRRQGRIDRFSAAPASMKSHWIKKLLFVLLGLVLVAVAALAWLVATFDAETYKARAVEWVKTNRDRTLVVDGPLKLSVLPRLALEVSKVRLSEKGSSEEFLALD